MRIIIASIATIMALASSAAADFATVKDRDAFLRLVAGKEITRPFINLRVTPEGDIAGRGARWDVTGRWTWQDGYFCRDLYWGGDDLGYNCQEVRANGDRIRFTADKGSGQSADFRLR